MSRTVEYLNHLVFISKFVALPMGQSMYIAVHKTKSQIILNGHEICYIDPVRSCIFYICCSESVLFYHGTSWRAPILSFSSVSPFFILYKHEMVNLQMCR
jgi:hypothetical protein